MSRTNTWPVHVFTVFAFAAAIVFFLIRDGSLREAGAAIDNLLRGAGKETVQNHK